MQTIATYMQLMLSGINILLFGVAFLRFLKKPHDTLAEQVKELEKRIDANDLKISDLKKSLDNSHEKHREQHETNEMFITCVLAFIDFEIAFCQSTKYGETADLYKAKETLQKYLAKK